MTIIASVFYAVATLLLAAAMTMDVTRGDVYNTGLLATRSSMITIDGAFWISGTVALIGSQICASLSKVDANRTREVQTLNSISKSTEPAREESGALAEKLREIDQDDYAAADRPERSISINLQTDEFRLIAAYAVTRGYKISSYLENGCVSVRAGFGSTKTFCMLAPAVFELALKARVKR